MTTRVWRFTVAATRRAHEMGVILVAGTDSFGNPNRDGAPNIHREMQFLVEECGLTPIEAIHAATYKARVPSARRNRTAP